MSSQWKYGGLLLNISVLGTLRACDWCKYVITGFMMVMLYEMAAGLGNRFVQQSGGSSLQMRCLWKSVLSLPDQIDFYFLFFNDSVGSVVQGMWDKKEYLAAQGQPYMLACKSCCPKLSWEQQSSESLWTWKDKYIWYFAYLSKIVSAVL